MRSIVRTSSTVFATALLALPMVVAQAQVTTFSAMLSGAAEAPPNGSPGTGSAFVTLDQTLNTMRIQVSFFGLTVANTAAHIHCCLAVPFTGTAGVATTTPTFTGFPAGTSGWYDATFNMLDAGSYNPAFVTAQGGVPQAYAALTAGLFAPGRTYLNIHTSNFPGGEIRGFLQVIPEPSTYALMVSGLVALGVIARNRRKT